MLLSAERSANAPGRRRWRSTFSSAAPARALLLAGRQPGFDVETPAALKGTLTWLLPPEALAAFAPVLF